MIQITDKSTIKAYYFPKSGSEMVSTLNLYSELTHAEYDFDVEESGSSSMYYTLVLDFSDVADGEYAYTLSNADGRVVESGELRVGTIGEGHVVYEYYESFTTYNPETGSEEHVPYYGDCAEAIQIAHEQGYEEGHEDGFAEGEETQKGKLGTKNIFINGTYTREDGWNQVNVAVPQPLLQDEKNVTLESPTAEIRPDNMAVAMKKVTVDATNLIDEAYAEGEANQKAKLTDKFITQNGTYEREDGWNKVTVAMPQPLIQDEKSVTLESPTAEIRPDGGAVAVKKVLVDATDLIEETFEEGKEAQKALMTSLNVTSNGSYEREDGYNSITVNVQGASIVEMTQAQYDALTEYDDNIIYAIIG